MQVNKFYIGLVGFFLAALVFGAMFFLTGMGDSSFLVSDGIAYGIHYIDKPRYDSNMQGFIFVLSFLGAGLLLCLLVILPDQRTLLAQTTEAPQPRRRPAPPHAQAAIQPQAAPQPQAPPQPQPAPQAAAAATPAPVQAAAPEVDADAAGPSPTVEIEPESARPPAPPAPPASPPEPTRSVEEEVLTDNALPEFSIDDPPDSRYEDTGDEDVVYGNGRVTDDSVWEFVQTYPDSAVKFLYRKNLENKALNPTEEDIYRRWEIRGMTRARVRAYVLEVMGWKALPDDFPHNIWRSLRDQIFEMKAKTS